MRAHFDIIVMGGGPAGVAAALAINPRRKVALVDEHGTAGTATLDRLILKEFCVQVASGSDFGSATQRAQQLRQGYIAHPPPKQSLQAAGVAVLKGLVQFSGPSSVQLDHDTLTAKRFLVATGATLKLPEFTGSEHLSTLASVTELAKQPSRVAIIGSSPFCRDLAKTLKSLGTRVELVDQNVELGSLQRLQRSLRLNWLIDGQPKSLAADLVLAEAHPAANLDFNPDKASIKHTRDGVLIDKHFRTTNRNAFAAGRCLIPGQSKYSSETQGSLAARAIGKAWPW